MMSQVDRQILTIAAPLIRGDLGLTDAQLGLLYGTCFALFYGVFGVPLAKLADAWNRVSTLWMGLLFWSAAVALGGFSTNFGVLGISRVGTGLGEASSTPAAASILSDYFERSRRATVLSLYTMGGYLGMGLSLMAGGAIIAAWSRHFPVARTAPLGLAAWQVVFLFLAVPGILLAGIVALTVREPERGRLDGVIGEVTLHPLRDVMHEIASMLPGWNLLEIGRRGGQRAVLINVAIALACAVAATAMILLTEGLLPLNRHRALFLFGGFSITSNMLQWVVVGIAVYALCSWVQFARLKDPTVYELTAGSRSFRYLVLASGLYGFCSTSVYAFNFLYAVRYLGFGFEDGILLGLATALAGMTGLAVGGFLGDFAKARHPLGRLYVIGGSIFLTAIFGLVQYTVASRLAFYALLFLTGMCLASWPGCVQATLMDIVIPRMRGLAVSLTVLAAALMGLGCGPYTVGFLSDMTGNLRFALLLSFASLPAAAFFVLLSGRQLQNDEQAVHARARLSREISSPAAPAESSVLPCQAANGDLKMTNG